MKDRDLNHQLAQASEIGKNIYRDQTKRYIKRIADSVQKELEDYIQANASILKKQNQQK